MEGTRLPAQLPHGRVGDLAEHVWRGAPAVVGVVLSDALAVLVLGEGLAAVREGGPAAGAEQQPAEHVEQHECRRGARVPTTDALVGEARDKHVGGGDERGEDERAEEVDVEEGEVRQLGQVGGRLGAIRHRGEYHRERDGEAVGERLRLDEEGTEREHVDQLNGQEDCSPCAGVDAYTRKQA